MSRRGWLLFATMGVIWGLPYLLIKVAVDEIAPTTLVLARTALAAVVLLPWAVRRGEIAPVVRAWRPVLAFAVVEIMVPWLLLGVAETRLSSSLTGLLVAAVPLAGAALALTTGSSDRVDARRLVGLLLGLIGVATLVGFEVGGGDAGAVAAIAVVAVCYAGGPMILARWLSDLPGLAVIGVSLGVTAVVYLPLGLAQAPSAWPSGTALASVAALALICTALAFVVFFALIAEVGPSRATVITYVNPAVAVLLGSWLLDEQITVLTAVGFALILAGSVLATGRPRTRLAPDTPAPRAGSEAGPQFPGDHAHVGNGGPAPRTPTPPPMGDQVAGSRRTSTVRQPPDLRRN